MAALFVLDCHGCHVTCSGCNHGSHVPVRLQGNQDSTQRTWNQLDRLLGRCRRNGRTHDQQTIFLSAYHGSQAKRDSFLSSFERCESFFSEKFETI